MGSNSDWPVMKHTSSILKKFKIKHDCEIVSAHRTPRKLEIFVDRAESEDVKIIIAGAGGAAHLPGMLASFGSIPVLGVPIGGGELNGLDSLLSISQMPSGIPVATFANGVHGAKNAGLFAVSCLSLEDDSLRQKYISYREKLTEQIMKNKVPR